MEYILWFIISYVLIFILYYFLFIRKARRNKKLPSEVQFLVYQYKLDIKKFSFRKFLLVVDMVTSFDIALVATIVGCVKGIIWQILFGFVAVIPVVVITFMLIGRYYQQKQEKDNELELEKEKAYYAKKNKSKKKVKKKGNK